MGRGAQDDQESVDRELTQLLDEVRVAIPGAEVLFAFLLGLAFTERFTHATSLQRHVYFATLLSTAAATALLIAPSAYHRIRFRDGDKNRMLYTATRMMIGSLILLLFAVSGAVFLVADIMYASPVAAIASVLTAAWFVSFWFTLPIMRRVRDAN